MKKRHLLSAKLCVAISFLLFAGCNKIDWDDLLHHPDKADKLCSIKKISVNRTYDTLIGKFTYNSSGDPTQVAFNIMGTGQPGFRFIYDNKKRLTDYLGLYGSDYTLTNFYEFWHHYVYDNGRIVRDTMRGFGEYPLPNNSPYLLLYTFEYDNSGRIVKAVQTYPLQPSISPVTETYTYNSDGNLEKYSRQVGSDAPYVVTYTYNLSKPNLHRTNKVWMFVDRDYSINAPVNATSYNQYGLPLKYDVEYYGFLYNLNIGHSTIEYQCK
ncbi:MAG: hypothetical protein QM731_07625 [Chitinophagaceae bacterium]